MRRRIWRGLAVVVLIASVGLFALVRAVRGPSNPASVSAAVPTRIAGVMVLDAAAGLVTGPADVVLRDGRIEAVGPAAGAGEPGLVLIEGAGLTLLPGLIDVHVHLASGTALPGPLALPETRHHLGALVLAGVTTVLDTSGPLDELRELGEATRHGDVAGPEILYAGPALTAPGGHPIAIFEAVLPWFLHDFVKEHLALPIAGPQEAQAAVAGLVAGGAHVIKVMLDDIPVHGPELDDPTLRAIVAAARAHDRIVIAHVGTDADARRAAQAGVGALVHLPYRDRITPETAQLLAREGIPVATTLQVWTRLTELLDRRAPLTALERRLAPQANMAALLRRVPELTATDLPEPLHAWFDVVRAGQPLLAENTRTIVDAGVTLLAGSDSANVGCYPGAALHRELELLVAAGVPAPDVLRAATASNAAFLGLDDRIGAVRPGFEADLLLVRGDPTRDIAAVSDIVAVWADGRRVLSLP